MKTIKYKNNYYSKKDISKLMVNLSKNGFIVSLTCTGHRQWEFKMEQKTQDGYVTGVGFGPFQAAKVCFWNWKNVGFAKGETNENRT